MRAMAASVAAGLAGLLVLGDASDTPREAGGPSGRASARRPRGRGVRADAGSDGGPDGGVSPRAAAAPEPPAPDAGVRRTRERGPHLLGDPPGRVRVSTPPATAGAQQPPAPEKSPRVEKLEQQVAELRNHTASLEAQLARSQAQASQLQLLNDQIAELRGQLAAEAQRKAQAEEAQLAQRQQVQQAVSGLLSAQQVLAGGSADVDAALTQAEATLSGDAQRDVAAARQSLRNRDLSAARFHLGAAVAHAQQAR
ncbi:MAG: hypothetical protein NVSMB23_02170 [Myxococcales bacterium]